MNEKTRTCIESHIERIAESFRSNNHEIEKVIAEFGFETQKNTNPAACPCYRETPCHVMEEGELNCFLCYCPEYDNSTEEGGCKKPEIGTGKWFYHSELPDPNNRIWDCSDCTYPNEEETVREYLIELLSKRRTEEEVRKYLKAIFGLQD